MDKLKMHSIIKRLSTTEEYFPCFKLQISTSDDKRNYYISI